jgi:NAD(P)-dependent dehydrogenase (short-subunit alcohol dehydrogenase family)
MAFGEDIDLLRTIVITGASSGIGAATAIRLAGCGYRLILNGKDESRLQETLALCIGAGAKLVTIYPGDLTERKTLNSIISASDPGNIHALINCAAMGCHKPLASVTDDEWCRLLDLNLSSVFYLCRHFGTIMADQGRGTIVNVSSEADTIGFPYAAAYCATKGGILLLSRSLQAELQPAGVRVCVVSPGRIDTRFNGKSPGMRPGALKPEEVAEVIEFAIECSPNIELREIRIDSMSRNDSLLRSGFKY